MFILGTSSVLALIPIDQIDLIAPIPQVLSVGFARARAGGVGRAGRRSWCCSCIRVAQASVMFAGNTRLPMVAGWDGLLPAWFTRAASALPDAGQLDPVRRRGRRSAFSIAGLIGVGKQEAFQLLWNASAIFYALTYLVMFAIPIAGVPAAPPWLKLASRVGVPDDAALFVVAVDPADRPGGEPAVVRRQDLGADPGDQRHRCGNLLQGRTGRTGRAGEEERDETDRRHRRHRAGVDDRLLPRDDRGLPRAAAGRQLSGDRDQQHRRQRVARAR